jgi:AcrR family transcriptional regulator
MDVAEELFITGGYEKTSIQEIIDRTHIARGTFYYHFKSKEILLDAVVERYCKEIIENVAVIAGSNEISSVKRLIDAIKAMQVTDKGKLKFLEALHRPQNTALHQKTSVYVLRFITPLLAQIVINGTKRGEMQTDFPYECSEMLITYVQTVIDGTMLDLTEEERDKKAIAALHIAERMIALPEGSLLKAFENE